MCVCVFVFVFVLFAWSGVLHAEPPAGDENDRQHPEDGSPVARVLYSREYQARGEDEGHPECVGVGGKRGEVGGRWVKQGPFVYSLKVVYLQ